MSLLNELQARGVTTEDLEKAAAVRLFEKVAASEGVDLNALDESQVIELFENFTSTPTSSKEASAMNDAVIDLFEKTAAAEGIDLDEMSDEDLAALYEHYVENVLPEQLGDDDVKVADAQEKLAEAEILGRHMARAYLSEIQKMAAEANYAGPGQTFYGKGSAEADEAARRAAERAGGASYSRKGAGGGQGAERTAPSPNRGRMIEDKGRLNAAKNRLIELVTGRQEIQDAVGNRLFNKENVTPDLIKKITRIESAKAYGKRLGAVGAAGGLAYAGKRMMDKKSSANDIYDFASQRADQFEAAGSVASHDGSFVDDLACDILVSRGYSLS